MGQFTVHRNRSARTKGVFPFLLDVQSDLLEDLNTRVVVPLARGGAVAKRPMSHLTPLLAFEGEEYVLMTPELAGVAIADLGAPAGSLANQRDTIIAAMDFLLAGF